MNESGPIIVGAASLASAAAVVVLLRFRDRLPLASTNARTLHSTPVPRVGGLALWIGWVPFALVAPASDSMSVAVWGIPWLLLAVVSFLDDRQGVAVAPRLAMHALAAGWFACALVGLPESLASAALVVAIAFAAAWSGNLFNFMDGSDGLAVTMALVGFAAFGAVLLHKGLPAESPLALAAATLPVLAVNRPPARMFLGDVGAVPLGFLAAAMGAGGVVDGGWPWWFPVLVFLPFIADASVTLARRMLAGERFWQPHKSHYYQRLHRMGAGHAGTLAVYTALILGTAGTAVACACVKPGWGIPALAAWSAVTALLFAGIDYHWRRTASHP
jgi:UDP-N-acetylmuramyl pentapeptide phosphotransferase/UDP-N-acetylglucosamine-1-phosphate transferase